MPPIVLAILNISQLGLCLWGGTYSYAAVTRLRQYEDTSEKAASISSTAEQELHKTRTTQTAGALVLVISLVWSGAVLLGYVESSSLIGTTLSALLTAGLVTARTYLSNFWSPKSGVPLVKTYNKGIENSKQLTKVLSYITVTSGIQAVYLAFSYISNLF